LPVVEALALLRLAAIVVGAAAFAGCEASPSDALTPTGAPTTSAFRPAIRTETWRVANDEWTFTGHVDPMGDSTDIVLEIKPAVERQFDIALPVAQDIVDAGPVTLTTRDVPDIAQICVRFTATNSAGTSFSTPLCFARDQPSALPDDVPPTTTFSAPATDTSAVIKVKSYAVAWTEADDGSGVLSRSLQRRAAAYAGGACGAYDDDAPASTATGPVAVSNLIDGRCYQWILTLADRAGNSSATTSGTVRVDVGSP
jgi:hypothetical protein